MQTIIRSILLCFLFASCGAPSLPELTIVNNFDPYHTELEYRGGLRGFNVRANGEMWISTAVGEIYRTKAFKTTWKKVKRSLVKYETEDLFSEQDNGSVDQIHWIDDKNGIMVGYLSDVQYGDRNCVLISQDAGLTWKFSKFPGSDWIYDIFILDEKHIWMGGSSGKLFFSDDKGKSWRILSEPYDHSSRLDSILMTNPNDGLAGALHNELKATHDGGKTWTPITTPLDQYNRASPDRTNDAIRKIIEYGDYYVLEANGSYYKTKKAKIFWIDLHPKLENIYFDKDTKRLFGLTNKNLLISFKKDLEFEAVAQLPATIEVQKLRVSGDAIYILANNGRILSIKDGKLNTDYVLSDEYPIRNLTNVQIYGDAAWASTGHFIYYRYPLSGRWQRVGFTETYMPYFQVRNQTEILLWSGHGENQIFNRETRTLRNVYDLRDKDLKNILIKGDTWYGFGGMQYETTFRIDVARTYFSGQFSGSLPYGFLTISNDRGLTWTSMHFWDKGGVANLYVDEQDNIYMYSYLGSIRKLEKKAIGYETIDLISGREKSESKAPYVEQAHAIYFLNNMLGYVSGWTHHMGNFYFETTDGGKKWDLIDPAKSPYFDVRPFTKDEYIGITKKTVRKISRGKTTMEIPIGATGEEFDPIQIDREKNRIIRRIGPKYSAYDELRKSWTPLF